MHAKVVQKNIFNLKRSDALSTNKKIKDGVKFCSKSRSKLVSFRDKRVNDKTYVFRESLNGNRKASYEQNTYSDHPMPDPTKPSLATLLVQPME